ncbi:hypothetical protein [Metabacillus idriensis]|uniref:hypothetical protein n=1 Tax=Metabacillus idriensis TaxID=324768 RepID=UPI001748F810|nr:hypothetical protein [Metabacillus idriensis]
MNVLEFLDVEFSFSPRPQYFSPDLNVERNLVLLTLILKICCRSNRSSFNRIQVLNWAIKSSKTRYTFKRLIENDIKPFDIIVRHEPWLNRILDIAVAEGLIEIVNGKSFQLSDAGDRFVEEIIKEESYFSDEKTFLNNIKSYVTENKLDELVKAVTHL